MAYKVLYRKYRPDSFSKIVGQKSIIDTLKNSIKDGTFSHAYIFTGPRGTGKTSTAKVLAKAINCENNSTGVSCNECQNCLNFQTSPDIIEIDAASNNGVDEIRELRSNVTLAPASSKYKIYIIDEVHMLSAGAFNALLKTLEEPPAHAIFILATTEVYKVPITILSRCQRFDFKKIDHNDMVEHLKYICKEEKIDATDEALEEIYSLSEGCLRDALGILDQTSKATKKITLDALLENYNLISNNSIDEILMLIKEKKIEELINKLQEFEDSGMNSQKLIKKIINYLLTLSINIKLQKEKRFEFNKIKLLIESLNKCYIDARINENVFTMIKLSFLSVIDDDSRSKPIEVNTLKDVKKANNYKEQAINEPQKLDIIDIRINNCFCGVNKESLNNILSKWNEINKNKIATIDLKNYTPVAASPDYIIFDVEEESLAELFNIKSKEIEKLLKSNEIPCKVVAISTEKWQESKERYKINIKNKVPFELIEEPKKEDNNSKIKNKLNDIFTEELIEIS